MGTRWRPAWSLSYDPEPVAYEHPLAYLLGLEGLALLRAFRGEFDREFVEARLAEVRRLLDETALQQAVSVDEVDTVSGYRCWSATYDDPVNGAFGIEQPIMRELIDRLPVGDALDAACGTGRHSQYLAERGHRVVGIELRYPRCGDLALPTRQLMSAGRQGCSRPGQLTGSRQPDG